MSKVVDNYAVRMDFDNSRFEKNVQTSLSTIDRLKKSVNFDGQANSLREFERVANSFDLSGMASSLSAIERRFSAFGIMGMRVLENLTDKVIGFMGRTSSFVKNSIITGGINRALNVENAHFMLQGLLHDEKKVAAVMQQAKDSVDGTAYSYDAAAKAASMFTASGIKAGKQLKLTMKSLADTTAATNSDYEGMSQIFTTIAGNGRLMGEQLLQLSSRGMNAAALLAKYYKKVRGEANITEAAIRDMVSKGQIDFQTFTEAMEYAFDGHAKKANETFQGVMANIRAALAKIGEGFISLQDDTDGFNKSIIAQNGPLVNMLNAVRERINDIKDGVKPLQKEFLSFAENALGQITKRLQDLDLSDSFKIFKRFSVSLRNLFNGFASVVTPIGEAFNDVFSPNVTNTLLGVTKAFKNFTSGLKLSDTDASNLYDTFNGIFSVLNLVKNAIKSVLKVFVPLSSASGSFLSILLSITGALGRWATSVSKMIEQSKVFEAIGEIFSSVAELIASAFDSSSTALKDFSNSLKKRLGFIGSITKVLQTFVSYISKKFKDVAPIFHQVASTIWDSLSKIGEGIGKIFAGSDFNTFLDLLNSGVVVAIGTMFDKFFVSMSKWTTGPGSVANSIKLILSDVRLSFVKLQKSLEAKTLQSLAIAIAILAGALLVLSSIDSKKMTTSLAGLTTIITELMGAFAAFSRIGKLESLVLMPAALIEMSIAILILASAVKKLSNIKPENMVVGLMGLSVLMLELVGISVLLDRSEAKMVKGSLGLILFAAALNIMANAVKKLGDLDVTTLARGLGSVAVLMGEIVIFSRLTDPKGMVSTGLGMIGVATALNIMAFAVERIGSLPVENIVKGLTGIGVALAEIGIFSRVVNPAAMLASGASMIFIATGLVILSNAISKIGSLDIASIAKGLVGIGVALAEIGIFAALVPIPNLLAAGPALIMISIALNQIGNAIASIGGLSWGEIAKGLITMAGSLTILAVASYAMTGALPGAAAMIVVAAALDIMVPAIMALSSLNPGQVAIALITLAGSFAIMGAAGTLLAPVSPVILALAASMVLLGISVAGIGIGISLAVTGLLALGSAITTLASLSGKTIAMFVKNLASVVGSILKFVSQIAKGVAKGVVKIIKVIGDYAPKIAKAGIKIVKAFLKGIRKIVPEIIKTGIEMIKALLDGIGQNIGDIVDKATLIITEFLNGLARNVDDIVDAGANLVKAFVKAILKHAFKALNAGIKLGKKALNGVKKTVSEWIKAGQDAVQGFVEGLSQIPGNLVSAASNLGKSALQAAKDALGIHSPSKEFMKIGEFAVSGLGIGFDKVSKSVRKDISKSSVGMFDSVSAVVKTTKSVIATAVNQAYNSGKSFSNNYSSGIQNDSKTAVKPAQELGENAVKALDESSTKEAEKTGGELVKSYGKGIKMYGNAVKVASEYVASLSLSGLDIGNLAKSMGKIVGGDFIGGLKEVVENVTPENAFHVQKIFEMLVPKEVARSVGANSAAEMVEAFNNALKTKEPKKKDKGSSTDKKKKTVKKESIKDSWGVQQLNETMSYLSQIFQQYETKFDAFNKKLLENGKITAQYLASSVKDKLLANAMRSLDTEVYDKLNKQVDEVYEKLVKKYKKFKKKLKLSDKEKTKLRDEAVKYVASGAIKEYTQSFKGLQKTLSKMTDKKTAKTIASIPSAVAVYLKRYNKSFKQVKGVIQSFARNYGSNARSAVQSLGQKLYEESDSYESDQKELKRYSKQLNKIYKKAEKWESIAFDPDASAKRKNKALNRLRQLAQQEKSIEKSLKKTTKNIAEGPAKAIEEFRNGIKETVKDFISLSNVDFSSIIDGFSKVEKSTNLVEEASTAFDIFSVSLATTSEAVEETNDAMGLLNVSVSNGMDLLQRFSKISTVSVRRLMKNATSQIKAYKEFQNGIKSLRNKGLASSVVDDLESQGPEALNYIRGFLKMSAEEIAEYNKLVDQKIKYEANATGKAIINQSKAYQQWEKNVKKLAGKIPEEMLNQIKEQGVDSADYVEALLNMDSKTLTKVGKAFTKSASKTVQTTTEEVAETGYKSFREGVKALAEQYDQWNKDLQTLSTKGLSNAVIAKLREMGVDQTKDYIESMLKETSKGIQEINSYFEKSQNQGRSPVEVWLDELKTTDETYEQWQKDMDSIASELGKDNTLYKALHDMGWEAGAEYANTFVNASESEKHKILDEFDKQQEYNDNAILNSLNERIATIKQWNNDLKVIAGKGGITDEFMKELINMGPEAAEQIHMITLMSQQDFEQFAESYATAVKSVPETISNDVTAAYAKVAGDAIGSFSDNVQSEESYDVSNKSLNKLVKKVAKAIKKVAVKNAKKIGKHTVEGGAKYINKDSGKKLSKNMGGGIEEGFANGKGPVTNTAGSVAQSAVNALKAPDHLNGTTGNMIATSTIDGIVLGFQNGQGAVGTAAGNVAAAAVEEFKAKLEINSPSKVFEELGKYTGEGFVVGLGSYVNQVITETDMMADTAVSNMSDALQKVNDVVNGNQNGIVPTIQPVIDTSSLYNDVVALRSMLESIGDITINIDKEKNKDVVTAINNMDQRLSSNMGELTRQMSKLQVVMDSGTLVGELVPSIDNALYRRTVYKQRGM